MAVSAFYSFKYVIASQPVSKSFFSIGFLLLLVCVLFFFFFLWLVCIILFVRSTVMFIYNTSRMK